MIGWRPIQGRRNSVNRLMAKKPEINTGNMGNIYTQIMALTLPFYPYAQMPFEACGSNLSLISHSSGSQW